MNLGTKALQVLKTVAPLLGTAIGGPFGTLAGTAISAALGTTDDKSTEDALLAATPDKLISLRAAESDFKLKMRELDISEEKLAFDDTASARQREIDVKDHTPAVLAYFVTAGFFFTLGYMLVYGKPAIGGDVMLVMVGSLGTAWATIIAYYYGSSSSAARKDKALADIAKS